MYIEDPPYIVLCKLNMSVNCKRRRILWLNNYLLLLHVGWLLFLLNYGTCELVLYFVVCACICKKTNMLGQREREMYMLSHQQRCSLCKKSLSSSWPPTACLSFFLLFFTCLHWIYFRRRCFGYAHHFFVELTRQTAACPSKRSFLSAREDNS